MAKWQRELLQAETGCGGGRLSVLQRGAVAALAAEMLVGGQACGDPLDKSDGYDGTHPTAVEAV